MNKFSAVIISAFFLFSNSTQASEKPNVIASFSIIGDMVREVAGDNVELTILVGANGDAHEYQPTASDAKKLANADLVLVNGLGFEGWLQRLVKSADYKGKISVVSQGIKTLEVAAEESHHSEHKHHEEQEGAKDPHAWQDLENGKIYVKNIADALSIADKENSKLYQYRAAEYIKKLDALHKSIKGEFSKIPAEKRKVITTHDAFAYFAKAYGIEFTSLQGVSTESEASAADMARIIEQVRAKKASALFLENMTDSRLIKQLQKDTGAYIGGTLYSDALSSENEPAGNYIAMFGHNSAELIKAMRK